MSKDTHGHDALIVHNGDELEPAIGSALASLLSTEPTAAEVDCAMNRIRSARDSFAAPVQAVAPSTAIHNGTYRWLLVAASLFVFCHYCIASTAAWAQVAKDFSDPLNEPRPLSTLAETMSNSAQPTRDIGIALRLVLLAHVTLLMLGLTGMSVTWLLALFSCFQDHWRKSRAQGSSNATQRQILFTSALLYAVGIILGAIWAQATWGRLWSWDPRETFGLFTLAFAVLWMRTMETAAPPERDHCRHAANSASVATIAVGAIVLMFILGNRYAALHSYGLPALSLPNLVFGLFAGCLIVIWISFALCSRSSRKFSEA